MKSPTQEHKAIMTFPILAFLLLFVGCGRQEEQPTSRTPETPSPSTPYGSVDEVKAYLEQINPYIQRVGQIQAEVEKQIGSSGKITSQNLAAAAEKAYPLLLQAREEFSRIKPPPLLAPFHRDIEKLMSIRLEAYRATLDGWKREQQRKDIAWHEEVEAKLQAANDLILELNGEMQRINAALQSASPPPQVARP